MRALVIISTDSVTDFDNAIRTLRQRERVTVIVLDENWDFPEHDALVSS